MIYEGMISVYRLSVVRTEKIRQISADRIACKPDQCIENSCCNEICQWKSEIAQDITLVFLTADYF